MKTSQGVTHGYLAGKNIWQFLSRGEDGRQIFGIDPREFAPWVTFFRLPWYGLNTPFFHNNISLTSVRKGAEGGQKRSTVKNSSELI